MGKYTLIITEKPDAAQRIAFALDVGQNVKRMKENGVPYYVARRDKKIVIVPALGHLYTVFEDKKGRDYYPVFSVKWVPKFVAERKAKRVRTWVQVITKLSKNADEFVDACDYDIEGSIIGYCVLKYACGGKEKVSRRMKYSTLAKEELERSYLEALPHLDFALIEAGKTRHEVDWLYGINLSRALTLAAKNWSGKYHALSAGRVQGPLLKLLVTRERAIRRFVPVLYWQIKAQVEVDGQTFLADLCGRRVETKREADAISVSCKGSGKVGKVEVRRFPQPAPAPFDLGALQGEAYTLFRYTPKKTLDTAQSLYLDALISYPRTSSQKLPSVIDHKSILGNLRDIREYRRLAMDLLAKPVLKPREGSRTDSAHPAIHPTGKPPTHSLSTAERNIWDIIVRRFMAVFGEPAIKQIVVASIDINDHVFYLKGKQTLRQGWQRFYSEHVNADETALSSLREGQRIDFKKIIVESKFTRPPLRYNPCSLLRKMEKVGIGTKATRAETIQTLYERKYVRYEKMEVTDLGFEVFEVLRSHCPEVISAKMTRKLEDRMNRICQNNAKREDVLISTVETLRPVLKELKEDEMKIGERLSNAFERTKLEDSTIGTCPICKTGRLLIMYSKRTGKRFIGCTNYFKGLCRASFPLPQRGSIELRRINCCECGWPTIRARVGRKAWVFCFNPDCKPKEAKRGR